MDVYYIWVGIASVEVLYVISKAIWLHYNPMSIQEKEVTSYVATEKERHIATRLCYSILAVCVAAAAVSLYRRDVTHSLVSAACVLTVATACVIVRPHKVWRFMLMHDPVPVFHLTDTNLAWKRTAVQDDYNEPTGSDDAWKRLVTLLTLLTVERNDTEHSFGARSSSVSTNTTSLASFIQYRIIFPHRFLDSDISVICDWNLLPDHVDGVVSTQPVRRTPDFSSSRSTLSGVTASSTARTVAIRMFTPIPVRAIVILVFVTLILGAACGVAVVVVPHTGGAAIATVVHVVTFMLWSQLIRSIPTWWMLTRMRQRSFILVVVVTCHLWTLASTVAACMWLASNIPDALSQWVVSVHIAAIGARAWMMNVPGAEHVHHYIAPVSLVAPILLSDICNVYTNVITIIATLSLCIPATRFESASLLAETVWQWIASASSLLVALLARIALLAASGDMSTLSRNAIALIVESCLIAVVVIYVHLVERARAIHLPRSWIILSEGDENEISRPYSSLDRAASFIESPF
jgi:hypothetical protein